jgi:hypothetical protein
MITSPSCDYKELYTFVNIAEIAMKPKFADELAWQQAELLMQPAYIRLVDQIRRQTEENSDVTVSYTEVTEPYPSNLLCLNKDDRDLQVDIWQLCFQICFTNFEEIRVNPELAAQIDTGLFDPDSAEVDWTKLDNKARETVAQVFARFKLLLC